MKIYKYSTFILLQRTIGKNKIRNVFIIRIFSKAGPQICFWPGQRRHKLAIAQFFFFFKNHSTLLLVFFSTQNYELQPKRQQFKMKLPGNTGESLTGAYRVWMVDYRVWMVDYGFWIHANPASESLKMMRFTSL